MPNWDCLVAIFVSKIKSEFICAKLVSPLIQDNIGQPARSSCVEQLALASPWPGVSGLPYSTLDLWPLDSNGQFSCRGSFAEIRACQPNIQCEHIVDFIAWFIAIYHLKITCPFVFTGTVTAHVLWFLYIHLCYWQNTVFSEGMF